MMFIFRYFLLFVLSIFYSILASAIDPGHACRSLENRMFKNLAKDNVGSYSYDIGCEQIVKNCSNSSDGYNCIIASVEYKENEVRFKHGAPPVSYERMDKLQATSNNRLGGDSASDLNESFEPGSDADDVFGGTIATEDSTTELIKEGEDARGVSSTATADQVTAAIDKFKKINSLTYKDAAEDAADLCSEKLDRSDECCSSPLNCIGSDGGDQAHNVGTYALTGLDLYKMIKGSSATSPAESCKLMSQMAKIGAGVQAATAGVCTRQKGLCSSACGKHVSAAKEQYNNCMDAVKNELRSLGGASEEQYEYACRAVKQEYQAAKSFKSSCGGLIAKAAEQTLGVAQSMIAVNLNKKCQELGENAPPITDFPDVADCSLTQNLNSPFCRAKACQRLDQVNNPLCAQFNNLLANTNSSQNDTDLGAGGSGSAPSIAGDGLGFDEEGQPLNIAETAPNENSFGVSGGGGAGGGVTAAASAGGGGGDRGGRGAGAAGSKKDLKGLFGRAKGGKGYQRSFAGRGGYRGRSFGKRGSRGRRSARSKFNLKKYLPGRSLYGKRKLASVKAKDRAGIASRHASIWKIVSDRYQVHCKSKQLQGCK